ncbi:MAG: bifunctional diguanylate cyclase/phosphodiesterase [Candidatus Sedimenticola sp. (ex Thyasira tokunagai)]
MTSEQQPIKRLQRLEWIVAAYMGTAALVLICGMLLSLYLLANANRQIEADRSHMLDALNNTGELLTYNIPLMSALDALNLAAYRFHHDLDMITLNPKQTITPFTEHAANLEQVAARLEQLLPHALASRTSLIDATLTLADIADEAAVENAVNNLQQLYRDSIGPMEEANLHIRQTEAQMKRQHKQLLSSVSDNNQRIQSQLISRDNLYQQPITILSVLTLLLLAVPMLLLGLLFRKMNLRIQLLERYANDIAQENFQPPPFDSSDKTGSLARTLGSLSLRVNDLLNTTRNQAKDAHYQANHDSLTGLPNRRNFVAWLTQTLTPECSGDKPCFLLFLDLDQFKDINDTLGHDAGDQLIRVTGKRLRHALHSSDHVARLGGDEFAAIINCQKSNLKNVADRILKLVAQPMELKEHKIEITASIGITQTSPDSTCEALFKQADIAMYYAKHNGRNNHQLFHPHLEEIINQRIALIDDLRNAIEQEHFELYLQPKIDIVTGEITGAETLLRWNHPERGVVSPIEFIPVAEECGLIIPLGDWVLNEACRIARDFHLQGTALTLAVNCSGKQLLDKQFVDSITDIISAARFPLERLEIEITETALMENLESSSEKLMSLRRQGIRIAIDDFGTGYSSLRYLKDLPVTTIKIDRSFVVSAEKSSHDAAIIHAIAALGGNLKLDVIAEGVETHAQLKLIHDLGIRHVQGYIFAKPMPLTDFQQLIDDTTRSSDSWRADTLLAEVS